MLPMHRRIYALTLTAVVTWVPLAFGQVTLELPAGIAVEATGDLVLCDRGSIDAVIRWDSASGDCSILSDASTGVGPAFSNPRGIAVEASGDLLVTDNHLNAVVRVDPVTGDRTIVSSNSVGAGAAYAQLGYVSIEASGDLIVTDRDLRAIFRVDPVTGDRTIVSDPGTGAGTIWGGFTGGIAIEASGDILLIEAFVGRLYRVDAVTGDRTIVSDAGTGSGPVWTEGYGVDVEASGDLVVADFGTNTVYRVDPITGDRTVVSDAGTGSGPPFGGVFLLAVESSGDLVVTDVTSTTFWRVDPVTGDRTQLCPLDECAAAPLGGCRSDGRSALRIKAGGSLGWKWKDGDPSLITDYGDPVSGSGDYNVCVYDSSASPQPLMDMNVPTGAGWSLSTAGQVDYYQYKNKTGTPDGIRKLNLKPTGANVIPRISVTGKGSNLPVPTLPATFPMTVQLVVNDGGVECWEAVYTSADKNNGKKVKATRP